MLEADAILAHLLLKTRIPLCTECVSVVECATYIIYIRGGLDALFTICVYSAPANILLPHYMHHTYTRICLSIYIIELIVDV